MVKIAQTNHGLVEYRLEGKGPVVLVLNGGHTNCLSPFEHEKYFIKNGYSLLILTRPGYGNTPLSSGRKAEEFAMTITSLLDVLLIEKVIVIGISAGGKTALYFAKLYPKRVSSLILESAVTYEKWPDFGTRIAAIVLFNKVSEIGTWSIFRLLGRKAPIIALKIMMKSLSSLNAKEVVSQWNNEERRSVLEFLLDSRSASGFLNDIKHRFRVDEFNLIFVPTLIIASSNDNTVSPQNSIIASQQIKGAELMLIPAESHLIWFSKYKEEIERKISSFIMS